MACNSDRDLLVPNSVSLVVMIKRKICVLGHFGYVKFSKFKSDTE